MFVSTPVIFRHWACFLGLKPEQLFDRAFHVVPHAGLKGYHGAFAFRRAETVVISVPEDCLESANAQMGADFRERELSELLQEMFPEGISQFMGLAFQGSVSRKEFLPRARHGVRLATESDAAALQEFANACSGEAWDHSAVEVTDERLTLCFEGDRIVAAASVKIVDGDYPNLGFVSDPRQRGKGYGIAVASAAIQEALSRMDIVLWQTLMTNKTSITIAEKLGVQKFAETCSVRFR